MSKRLIACFDGTWNTPDDNEFPSQQIETNARRIYEAILDKSVDGQEQVKWYDKGVGTEWFKFTGGAFGLGLSENIRQGYEFLIENYEEGDELFLFGFSRGAYTARSLAGLIRKCGLLRENNALQVASAYEIYRTRDDGPDSETAVSFRERHSREIRIKFIGVWDTVGALGIPACFLTKMKDLWVTSKLWKLLKGWDEFPDKQLYQFHNTELSKVIENAYHALAIDEHRKDYEATLWTSRPEPHQKMEQRWFIGAHADVGGGYKDRRLSDITLKWMQEKAQECGLTFNPLRVPQNIDDNYRGSITDSYGKFLGGTYSKLHPRNYREVGQKQQGNEVVDGSVAQRLNSDLNYRPENKGLFTNR
jgi:uncharacterized protein (DUF2235 family)